jgi:HK97 gp10 family phage protein
VPDIKLEVLVDNTDAVKGGLKSAFARALERIGLQAEGYAKDLCPVDTGNLRNSITHTSDGKAAYIGTNVTYGKYVELGTVKMAAQPYLRPAAADHGETYRNIVKDELSG